MTRFDSPRRLARRIAVTAVVLCIGASTVATAGESRLVDDASGEPALASPLRVSHVTSGFAMRSHPIKKRRQHHSGVDFAAPLGAPVRSVDAGVVAFAGTQKGYGKVIYIDHEHDRTTVYAHLHRIDVRNGDRVRQGDPIGTVGKTGLASGPHLHFEVHERGKPIDPMTLAFREVVDRSEAIVAPSSFVASANAVPCIDLLQKASLQALEAGEVELLRQGCLR